MKKKILAILIAFVTFVSVSPSKIAYAQDCSFACRVPGSATCVACQNSKGPSIPGSSSTSNSSGGQAGAQLLNGDCIQTAIGCIPVLGGQDAFLGFILRWAIGIGGGIAFLLIVYAGFMVMTSSGNPDRLKAGQELLTSAISGVILLVLSVFILNLIGVKILAIPGFGK